MAFPCLGPIKDASLMEIIGVKLLRVHFSVVKTRKERLLSLPYIIFSQFVPLASQRFVPLGEKNKPGNLVFKFHRSSEI